MIVNWGFYLVRGFKDFIFFSKSVLTIIWAFCCGLFAIVWLLMWIGIWISLTYYTVVTIQRIGITPQDVSECDATIVTVSAASLIVVWIVFIGLCCLAGFAAFKNKTQSSQRRNSHTKENIYDSVPQENIYWKNDLIWSITTREDLTWRLHGTSKYVQFLIHLS